MNNTDVFALTGADIYGESEQLSLTGHAIVVAGNTILDVCPIESIDQNVTTIELAGGFLTAGFIDLQVNGGGGVQFNNAPTLQSIKTICSSQVRLGTCKTMVTLISCDKATTRQAIEAATEASRLCVPGFLGLHLEGPHLSTARKGAHNEAVLRDMSNDDLQQLLSAKENLEYLMVTVAPERVNNDQINTLMRAGIVVSLGHSDASCEQAEQAYKHGARSATHLYNAMSPLQHRAPGMVGATLTLPDVFAGIIADGVHVSPAAISLAVRSKNAGGKLYLVSDAMAPAGTSQTEFELDGRTITRNNGKLVLPDGTLAGADTDLLSSVNYLMQSVGVTRDHALRMASLYPAQCIGANHTMGTVAPGCSPNLIHIDKHNRLKQVWLDGVPQLAD